MENTTTPVQPTPVAPQAPMQPAPKSGHKVLWIVLAIVGIIIILVAIGIYKIGSAVSEYVDVENGQVSIKGENGESITYGGTTLPANWPSDVPNYPTAEVKFSASNNDTQGNQNMAAVFASNEPVEKITEYYKNELAKNMWTSTATTTANNSTTLSFEKGNRNLAIILTSESGQTIISLAVVTK